MLLNKDPFGIILREQWSFKNAQLIIKHPTTRDKRSKTSPQHTVSMSNFFFNGIPYFAFHTLK